MTDKSDRQDIPEMNLDDKYSNKKIPIENPEKVKKEMEKTKEELEKLKSYILKKYSYTKAIGILPPQSIKLFVEEEEVPKETEKHIHLLVIIPEEKVKKIPEIRKTLIQEIDKAKQKLWLHIMTPVDIWETCLDSKFELFSAIAMSFPLYDKGLLGALRVSEIHKSLVLQKFEKYVVSYVIGGSLVRGEAIKTSDVDIFIVINDTDVKKMPRLELKEKLRAIIYQYVAEATALAGVKNQLSPQVYLLTDFWESVKDAHPVIFTFIRDGIPIYDRHTFMPWKALLKMGKLKPSPESIDMFMSMGDKTVQRVKRALLDLVLGEICWSVITPSQALLMLYGLPPPNVKETVREMKRIFYDKEKMLEKKYIDILEEIAIKYYKGYEHNKIKEVSGKEVDKLLANTEDYLKRLKELREQIEKRSAEKTIEQIYDDVMEMMKSVVGKKTNPQTITEFEENFVKKGKFSPQHLRTLREVIKARAEYKKGKLNMHHVDESRKDAQILINDIIEFNQRCDLSNRKEEKKTQ
jgi:predicted nucleotidyltransferase